MSTSPEYLDILFTQIAGTQPLKFYPDDQHNKVSLAAIHSVLGIEPKGELEGMIAAQLAATHNASMECIRRAMALTYSKGDLLDRYLNQANKLSRTFVTLLEALNKHRGKGQQKVTVEHVHVHQGGQAIVGHVEHQGGGVKAKPNGSTPCS